MVLLTFHLRCPPPQDIKTQGGASAVAGSLRKIKAEAEKLEVMDKAAGILAELLYTEKLLSEIKEYRPIMLLVSGSVCTVVWSHSGAHEMSREEQLYY